MYPAAAGLLSICVADAWMRSAPNCMLRDALAVCGGAGALTRREVSRCSSSSSIAFLLAEMLSCAVVSALAREWMGCVSDVSSDRRTLSASSSTPSSVVNRSSNPSVCSSWSALRLSLSTFLSCLGTGGGPSCTIIALLPAGACLAQSVCLQC